MVTRENVVGAVMTDGSGSPDPTLADLPRDDGALERWSVHGRFCGADGGESAFTVMFLRGATPSEGGEPATWHALMWSVTRPGRPSPVAGSYLDAPAVAMLQAATVQDRTMDPRMRAALADALADGRPVPPDRLFPAPVEVSADRLSLDYGGIASLRGPAGGTYELMLQEADGRRLELTVEPTRPPLRHSDPGNPVALEGHWLPGCTVRGAVTVRGEASVRVLGSAWYDRSWMDGRPAPDVAWCRLAVDLVDGPAMVLTQLELTEGTAQHVVARHATAVTTTPIGSPVSAPAVLEGSGPWTSLATLNSYPTRWTARISQLDADLTLTGRADAGNEIRSLLFGWGLLSTEAEVTGTVAGRPVRGRAHVEVVPAQRVGHIEEYLNRLQAVTRREVNRLYPDHPSPATTAALMGGTGTPTTGLCDRTVHDTLVKPIRHLTDAGGRGWRTYVCCAAIELLGTSSAPYAPLMAMVEVIHSANLAIDDVQDGSLSRRGVPAVHTVYGMPTAVNAATAAYFVFDRVFEEILPPDDSLRLRVYQKCVRCLGAAHGGQAVDIAGHSLAMDTAVAAHDSAEVLARVQAAHRFKAGLPARCFAEIGASIAGADEQTTSLLGDYFEAVGTAYQITDDLLDLHGATVPPEPGERRKHCGEDLAAGKVTMPLARAVPLLPPDEIARLWAAVRDGGADPCTVREVATAIVDSGAVQACYQEAESMVDAAWRRLDPFLPNSVTKVMVRALGTYAAVRGPEIPSQSGALWR
ncbi:polyprenyl synthetase family protein [Streptomyces virginiae]|uniref:polyprenyl synthetase family protein n=1 Tax=Streptomyces virginiae TaxID=1961 RepID=UPI00382E69DE